MNYYRFPCGMFEDIGPPWAVMKWRSMPATPAGDTVCEFYDKAECDKAVEELNQLDLYLDEARERYPGDIPYNPKKHLR